MVRKDEFLGVLRVLSQQFYPADSPHLAQNKTFLDLQALFTARQVLFPSAIHLDLHSLRLFLQGPAASDLVHLILCDPLLL